MAVGVDGSVILGGSLETVKAAISRGPTGGLAADAGFKAAQAGLGGDALGSVYLDVKGYLGLAMQEATKALGQLGAQSGRLAPSIPPLPSFDTALLPGWVAVRVQAEPDHLVLDTAAPLVPGGTTAGLQDRVGSLAASLPSDTVAQYELHDVGNLIKAGLTRLESMPGGPTAAQVDDVANYVGGVDKAVGWLADADAVVLNDSTGFEGGLVAQTNDASASGGLITSLRNLVTLGGAQVGVTVGSETYAGQTITLVGVDLPGHGGVLPDKLQIALAQTDQLVIVGIGDGFVKSVLDTKAGSSLADQPAYQRSLGLAGSSNVSQGFVDVTAVRTALEALVAKSQDVASYDSNVKPFLEPIESIAWSGATGSDLSTSRIVLVLK